MKLPSLSISLLSSSTTRTISKTAMITQDDSSYLPPPATTKIHESFPSYRDVTYSCGSCGYALNLSSSNQNTANIGSKYGKAIKKGVISFLSIDESRFSESDELSCTPYFRSKHSWGLFRRRTSLLCHKCGNHIGDAYEESLPSTGLNSLEYSNRAAVCKKYNIKISALQPSSNEPGNPLSL